MSITYQQGKDALVSLHSRYMAYEPDYKIFVLGLYDNLLGTPEHRYQIAAETLLAVAHEGTVDPSYSSGLTPDNYLDRLPASVFVDFLYPDSSSRQEIINSIESGSFSKVELGMAAGVISQTRPSYEQLVDAVELTTGRLVVEAPIVNHDAALYFPGVPDVQLDFLVSMYIGAFSRAPEYEGIKFWAGDYLAQIASGRSEADALLLTSENMYYAGMKNGESGTGMSDSSFVQFAYSNALGRDYDQGGYEYWVEQLAVGNVSRAQFLHAFLTSALSNPADGSYLTARLEVAKHAAQEHVSGEKAPGIDLVGVLNGVSDSKTAAAAINSISEQYGVVQLGTDSIDTAIVAGAKSELIIGEDITFLETNSGPVAFYDVERLIIDGKHYAVDLEGNGGQAYRIYQAALGRTPDTDGLGYWIKQMDDGISLNSVAKSFLSSVEFQGLYGANPSNEDFVSALYTNVLGRNSDAAGFEFWVDSMNSGGLTKEDVLVSFSESVENKIALVGSVEHGIEFTPYM